MLNKEESKILLEDTLDLIKKTSEILNDYDKNYTFKYKDKAIILLFGNLIGQFICSYATEEEKSEAIQLLTSIIAMHLDEDYSSFSS
jgi:hypothetical protein